MLRTLLLSIVVVLSSISAQADPVVVTGGGSNSNCCRSFTFAFQNGDSSIAMNFITFLTVNPIGGAVRGGMPFYLNFSGSGLDIVGTLVASGVSYPAIGDIHILTAPVLAPTSFIGEFHIFTSFTFTGGVIGFDSPFFTTANELIRFSLIGNGVLDATIVGIDGGHLGPVYTVTHITYTLPTPEPATLGLLLTGIGAAALRSLRKRSRRTSAGS